MLKHLKRVLSLILVLALVLPGMVFANGTDNEVVNSEDLRKNIQDIIRESRNKAELVEDYNDEEIVRIIVELEDKPVIVHATELGQRYEDMSYSERNSIESTIYMAQEVVKNQISARNINMTYARSFATVFNGFSGEVRFDEIETIESIKGVKNVYISNEYERPVIEPTMDSSNDMIGSPVLWDEAIGYKGEGMVIAIIDTGVDPSHKDFVLSDETTPKLSETDIVDVPGKFFTEKVPYGYNYYDLNDTILDLGPDASEHGMHVAGTVTANGEIKGVAPESQVLAMKVFSNDPVYATTFDDIYLDAIEDAIELKADVLNMSLGSTASFYVANSAVDTAITNATENGIVCSISAGNSGYTQYGWTNTNSGYPLKQDPDYGLVGAPSLSKDSISVASIENTHMKVSYLEYIIPGVAEVLPNLTMIVEEKAYNLTGFQQNVEGMSHFLSVYNNKEIVVKPIYIKVNDSLILDLKQLPVQTAVLPLIVEYRYTDEDGVRQSKMCSVLPGGTTGDGETVQAPMALAGPKVLSEEFTGSVEFVDGGSGHPSELTNVAGKVAIVVRGGLTPNFTDKIINAEAAGAIAVIVRNHETGGEVLVNMQYPAGGTIPAGFIGYIAGNDLMELKDKFIEFPSGVISVPNVNSGQMSDFTSWGTTPTLELKPEITAPGGQIYSTLQNDKYGMMSGTSMAAPHLSGGAALVRQYINGHPIYGDLEPADQTRLAKVLLMNTANVVFDQYDTEYSPRRQGAGLMNLYGAVSTPVRVVDAITNEAKVELKDFDETEFTMSFKAINDSDTDATYAVDVTVLADYIHPVGLNLLVSDYINDAIIDAPKTITVPANGEYEFEVKVDISKDETVYRNMFVEGFVTLTDSTDSTDENPELSVPFVGFYGDWDEPRILDKFDQDTEGTSYYGYAGMLKTNNSFYGDIVAISPKTADGIYFNTDTVNPLPSFLRNAEEVEYNILDEYGTKIRTIRRESFVRKNYIDGGRRNPYSLVSARKWDGTAKNQVVENGLYQYQIKAKVQNGKWQEKLIPVYVDTVAPKITNLAYDKETGILSWEATDKTTNVTQQLVYVNGNDTNATIVDKGTDKYEANIKTIMDQLLKNEGDNLIEVISVDNAMNIGAADTTESVDNQIPYIYLLEPGLLEIYDTKDIVFEGYVLKNNEITSVKVNGEEAVVKFSKEIVHLEGTADETIVSGYTFSHTLTGLADGYHEITVESESLSGTKASIVRRFYVDTTKPEFATINLMPRAAHSRTAELEITMRDNMQGLTLYVFDSAEFYHDNSDTSASVANPTGDVTTTVTVNLDLGANAIPLKLVDAAGNEFNHIFNVDRIMMTDEQAVAEDKEALVIDYTEGDSEIILPTKGRNGTTITWSSNNTEIISNTGEITLPAFDTVVTLTATIAKEDATDTKDFVLTVKGDPNPIKGTIEAKYGEMPVGEESGYLAYVQFSLKDKFHGYPVTVNLGSIALESKTPVGEFGFRFEGLTNLVPSEVIITIDGVAFDITAEVAFELMNNQEIMQLIEEM